MTADLSLG